MSLTRRRALLIAAAVAALLALAGPPAACAVAPAWRAAILDDWSRTPSAWRVRAERQATYDLVALLGWVAERCAARAAPALTVAARLDGGALTVTWQAPPGQALACVVRRRPDALLGCVAGPGGVWSRGAGSVDGALVVSPGDALQVTSWAADGALLGQGEAHTLGPTRWLPLVRR